MFVELLADYMPDFGTACSVGGVAVHGIFDAAYADVFGIVAGTRPALLIASADAPDVAIDDAVTIGATTYTVAVVQPDGTGMTRLLLEAA